MKATARSVATLAAGLLLGLVLAELVLQLLPVTRGLDYDRIDATRPLPRYLPNQSAPWSRGCDLSAANEVVTNAEGYTDRQDFARTPGIPVGIIGDSYVEAFTAAPGTAIDERLEQYSGGRYAGLRMGLSKAGAPTYAVLARHAVAEFGAQAVAIVITGGDFTIATQPVRRLYHYDADGRSTLSAYQAPLPLRLLKHSALLSYFNWNCPVTFRRGGGIHMAGQPVAAAPAAAAAPLDAARQRAMQLFLAELGDIGLPRERIVFLVDGNRRAGYPQAQLPAAATAEAQERAQFMRAARAAGHEVIDLMDAFRADFAANGRYFEYPNDNHWNADGHRVAALALLGSGAVRGADVAPAL